MRVLLSQLSVPLIQAPMAGAQDEKLAIAVAQAGGLGSLPAAMLTPEQLAQQLQTWRETVGDAPVNVNFFAHQETSVSDAQRQQWEQIFQPIAEKLGINLQQIPISAGRKPFDSAMLKVVQHYRPAVVSFHFGLPEQSLLNAVKATGARILASATTLDEARFLAAQGVDAIIAQGWEAGGHRGWFLNHDVQQQSGIFALLPQLVRELDVPIIAAGGISNRQTVQAAFALGAVAVQAGTAFLLADEATILAEHRAALLSDAAEHTAVTNLFSGGAARGIVTPYMQQLGCLNEQALPFPHLGAYAAAMKQAAAAQGLAGYTSLWAGQNALLAKAGRVAEIVQRLMGNV
ncbi:NAD(P)H-dependent flavin oxidoreductase [Neisseriaceae bacterium B1]